MKKLLLLLSLCWITASQGVQAQTRLGLHYTDAELAVWKARTPLFTGADKYVNTGDVSTNSPGDWSRIVANKTAFNSSPSGDRYTNYHPGTGAVPKDEGGAYDPKAVGYKTRDAGFYYLITGDATTLANVRTELLWHAQNTQLDFSNRSRWVAGGMSDVNPGFVIAEWLIRMVYAYDYVKAGLSSGDRAILLPWFLNAGRYIQTNYDPDLNSLFVNRTGGNYALSQAALNKQFGLNNTTQSSPLLLYYGGPSVHYVSKFYSNRRDKLAACAGLMGLLTNDATLIASGKRYVKEFVMFAMLPDFTTVDFSRSLQDGKPDKGPNYGENSVLYAFVDALARAGDPSLYTLSTSEGDATPTLVLNRSTDGTTQKSILKNIKKLLDMGNHVGAPLYSSKTATTNVDLRMDWDDAVNNTHYPNYLAYAAANVYYQDTYINQSIKRTYGSQGGVYLASPTYQGAIPAYQYYGMYPGACLMFVDVGVNVFGATPAKTPQTITFNALPAKTYGDAAFTPPAFSSSGLALSWASSNTAAATVNASTGLITLVGAGTTNITTSQAGNSTYFPAQDAVQSLTVNQKAQTIAFGTLPDLISTASPFILSATATSGLTVGFDIASGPARLGHDTLYLTGDPGFVSVRSYQAGNTNYLAAQPIVRTFNVTPATPPTVSDLLSGVAAIDSAKVVYDDAGQQRLRSSRHFVLPTTHTGYNIRKVTIPSGFGLAQNTLGKVELWVRNASAVSTFVQLLDATAQPILETPISFTGTVKEVYFVSYGASIPARVPAGATGIKLEGN